MEKITLLNKKKMLFVLAAFQAILLMLIVRVIYIEYVQGEFLQEMAYIQQTRDRLIAPKRGDILDRNMVGIARSETVASISVIHNQLQNKEVVATALSERLELDYDEVMIKLNRRVALERIAIGVDKETADQIRALNLPGVVVDEGIKRIYPFDNLASHVIGFVGRDNQGIIGLEAKFERFLKGTDGKILTETDVRGRELERGQEYRTEPIPGNNLVLSIDVILQQYAEQAIANAVEAHNAKRGLAILMNPQTGEIYAMANKPDFNLNDPFTINVPELYDSWSIFTQEEQMSFLNQMWRNFSINDTYEPGSTFKIVTAAAGLEMGVITPDSPFVCGGSYMVGDRQIKCWRYPRSHGAVTFTEGVFNSCNPVFMQTAERLGVETFYRYMFDFGFNEKTGIDVPGEAAGIMHKMDNVGPVELATMSFGQSFQITPLQLLRAGSAIINGGYLITPHFARKVIDSEGNIIEVFEHGKGRRVISQETSDIMREILEGVVYEGTGRRTYIPGYRVGGKTATSEKLPRRSGKYIASFLSFAPAEDPQLIALVLIDEPQGAYYGGQVAGPIMQEILGNTLPYLNIRTDFNEEELEMPDVGSVVLPNFMLMPIADVKKDLEDMELEAEIRGLGNVVINQFPLPGEEVNKGSTVILFVAADV
ncbi:MAG: penicillin-binding transpeptidase domain-containing protein [Defluviitaleaceae bacterium]|nr:penicillin-binding transpeptidase domain-containing protein [Defluviitaleaceae bacterium]